MATAVVSVAGIHNRITSVTTPVIYLNLRWYCAAFVIWYISKIGMHLHDG